jgi:26S proteasome regulatory subunit (ATPase 3-interacting protein)
MSAQKESPKEPAKKKRKKHKEVDEGEETKRKKSVSTIKNSETEKIVFEYLREQNRPYSILNIFDNLHAQFKKPELQEALDKLVKQKAITAKEFGKAVIYFVNQDDLKIASEEELKQIDDGIKQQREALSDLANKFKSLQFELKKILDTPTNEELQSNISKIMEQQEQMEKKLKLYKSDTAKSLVSEEEMKKVEAQYNEAKAKAQKTKNLGKALIDMMSASMDMKVKEYVDLVGIDL